jgi:thiosulfate/3-mercaptopyruvate sulfurtransferase
LSKLKDAAAKFNPAGVREDRHTIVYCGGGLSATIVLFVLHRLGFDALTLYDGSMARWLDGSMGEWAKDPAMPIERG